MAGRLVTSRFAHPRPAARVRRAARRPRVGLCIAHWMGLMTGGQEAEYWKASHRRPIFGLGHRSGTSRGSVRTRASRR